MSIKTTSFNQEVTINTSPEEIYDQLMDADKHAAFTGGEAVISKEVGGAFSIFDGYARGKNIELVPGKKIVQTWQVSDDGWPEDHYSEITFDLLPDGANKTKIKFEHRDVPAEIADNYKQGWIDYYWTPLEEMFGE